MSDYANIYECAKELLSKDPGDCIIVTEDYRQLATLALNHKDMNDWETKYNDAMERLNYASNELANQRNEFRWLQPVVENLARAVAKDRSDY